MDEESDIDDGTWQDLEMSLRFYVNQIKEAVQQRVMLEFGKEVTPEEAMALDDVGSPFDAESPEEMEEGMTQEEYEEARAEYFARVEKLRPTFLRLFGLDEETVESMLCDLGDPSTDEIGRLDAFLVTAFRLRLQL